MALTSGNVSVASKPRRLVRVTRPSSTVATMRWPSSLGSNIHPSGLAGAPLPPASIGRRRGTAGTTQMYGEPATPVFGGPSLRFAAR